jgi:hypothetical protein
MMPLMRTMTPEATPPLNIHPESQLHFHFERKAGGVPSSDMENDPQDQRALAEPRLGPGSRGEAPHRAGQSRCTATWMSERQGRGIEQEEKQLL